jgi:hypothetical protein
MKLKLGKKLKKIAGGLQGLANYAAEMESAREKKEHKGRKKKDDFFGGKSWM